MAQQIAKCVKEVRGETKELADIHKFIKFRRDPWGLESG